MHVCVEDYIINCVYYTQLINCIMYIDDLDVQMMSDLFLTARTSLNIFFTLIASYS